MHRPKFCWSENGIAIPQGQQDLVASHQGLADRHGDVNRGQTHPIRGSGQAIACCAEGSHSKTMGLIPSPEQSAGEGRQRRIEAHQLQSLQLRLGRR